MHINRKKNPKNWPSGPTKVGRGVTDEKMGRIVRAEESLAEMVFRRNDPETFNGPVTDWSQNGLHPMLINQLRRKQTCQFYQLCLQNVMQMTDRVQTLREGVQMIHLFPLFITYLMER